MSEMTPATQATIRGAIGAANRAFMDRFNAADPQGAARGIYTENARILPPGGEMIQGRDAIMRFWQAGVDHGGLKSVQLETVDLQPAGDGMFEIGRAVVDLAAGEQVRGKYVVLWKREGGDWRWDVDIWNFDA